jgi:hypothetical protein
MAVFWDVGPCTLVDTDRRFRGAYYIHRQEQESKEPPPVIEKFILTKIYSHLLLHMPLKYMVEHKSVKFV